MGGQQEAENTADLHLSKKKNKKGLKYTHTHTLSHSSMNTETTQTEPEVCWQYHQQPADDPADPVSTQI